MTEQNKTWFESLTIDRSESAGMLEKPSMRGVQRSVVDKYSDQAHFIYELLQNADDVRATTGHFRLDVKGLFFAHNGPVRFTLSNPHNEEVDTNNGTLGHINAITSIANSNKTESSIGKFGVGFKAVFQYTRTPHIYDPQIQFKIERFIVPHMLDSDLDWRKPEETVFFFPFDHKIKRPQDCHDEILEKLQALEFPVLFLSNLCSVSFKSDSVTGRYTKEITREVEYGDITVQWLTLALEVNGKSTTQRLVMFNRQNASGHSFSLGYGFGADGRLEPIDRPAFCFFPTKEATTLKFVLHAPFLLTDSREGIKAGEKHNHDLVKQLAQLAADSLPILRDNRLIDDGILDIIPYDEEQFSSMDDRRKLSFSPIFTAIKSKFQTDSLLPTINGICAYKQCSFWASDTELIELFSDEQLAQLTGVKDARWVFRSRGKKEVQSANREMADYIDGGDARAWNRKEPNLIVSSLTPEDVLKKINHDFISSQPLKWLHNLYSYLSERTSYQRSVKYKPIFLDQCGQPTPAFDIEDQLILFLPDDDIDGYTTVNQELLSNKATREFFEKVGVKKPSLRDEIYNKILLAYCNDAAFDNTAHFMKFFRYFKECRNEETASFVQLIKDKKFLRCKKANDPTVYRAIASELYLPSTDLKAWFETKPETLFLSLNEYREMVDASDHENLMKFFEQLGVRKSLSVFSRAISRAEVDGQCLTAKGKMHKYEDKYLDGCEQIIASMTPARSVLLWRILSNAALLQSLNGQHTWVYYHKQNEYFKSTEERRLLTAKWILNKAGELVSADAVTIQSLSDAYGISGIGAEALIKFLEIRDEAQYSVHLSEEESRKIRLADEIEKSGLSEEEIRTAIEDAKRRKNVQATTEEGETGGEQISPNSPLIEEIERRRRSVTNSRSPRQKANTFLETVQTDTIEDTDDFTPKAVDYGKKLERVKDRFASELDRIEREQALNDKANALPRYSFGWFLAMLELESMASGEKNADGKTISISFGKIERDSKSPRTVLLKEPSRCIPQSIEEFSGVRVDLEFGDGRTGKLRIESFTAQEFLLLGKLESADELSGIDLGQVCEARIEVQNPSFLLRELLERFRELPFDQKFDMKAGMTPDIEFVFGPPGTGKTTHLAENVLIPRMRDAKKSKVLVLTPTNKAADVLTTRIMEKMGDDSTYLEWLVRFGTSADEHIENAGVWRDRSFDINALNRCVLVTTIARFSYDGFAGENGKRLNEINWDTIVFDEASMISLASIIYPLYSQSPQKFIIAGDPFQIEPIVAIEQWKDENIFTLVGLDKAGSFANPSPEPYNYPITNLEKQYRSIPAIGEVFSRFTYDGILKHHRDVETQLPLKFNGCTVQPLNLIKFPVSKYESIYRAKRLESGTPYQTYSALFSFEFLRWLAGQIHRDCAARFSIGVIAPYRAQANLLSRLNDSWATKPDAVDIQVGTIHGFQGDECDIIIAVFNPPPAISRSPQMFLNKQNILNVAISRARDYLFIVMPDNETEGVDNLHKIAMIEAFVKSSGAFHEYASHAVEEMIWGNSKYLEENTFSTGHQMVNVYRKPERYYEVRSDDMAIDVQVHDDNEITTE
ncbi:DEAD/DEAH box helicase [Pirellulaceae bacterium SH449]